MTRPGFWQCPWCPEDFMHYHNLSFHIRIQHSEKREIKSRMLPEYAQASVEVEALK